MPVCILPSCSVAWCVTHSSFGLALQKKTTNLKKLIFSYVFSMCVILTFIGCFMWLLLDYSRFLSLCCFFNCPGPFPPHDCVLSVVFLFVCAQSTSRKLSKEVESFELIRTSCWLAFTGTAAQMSARVNFA